MLSVPDTMVPLLGNPIVESTVITEEPAETALTAYAFG